MTDHLLELFPALSLLGELLAGVLGDELRVREPRLQDQVLVSRLKDLPLQQVLLLSDLREQVPQLLMPLQTWLSNHCRILHSLQIVPLHLLKLGSDLSEFVTDHVSLFDQKFVSPPRHLLLSLVELDLRLLHLDLRLTLTQLALDCPECVIESALAYTQHAGLIGQPRDRVRVGLHRGLQTRFLFSQSDQLGELLLVKGDRWLNGGLLLD